MSRKTDQLEILKELQSLLDRYLKAEKNRLLTERKFLKSVLKSSLGGAQKKAEESESKKVLAKVEEMLRVRKDKK